MLFENNIWRAAWDAFRRNWKTVAAAILAATAYDLLMEYTGKRGGGTLVVELFIWGMVAISAHGTVLLGTTDLAFSDKKKLFLPFVWRSLILLFLSLIPFLIALFAFYEKGDIFLTLLKTVPVLGLAALVIFALLGTCLPAVVAGGDRRIGAAIDRAERSFFYSAARLFLGPGLLQIAFVSAGLILLTVLPDMFTGDVFGPTGFSFTDLLSMPVIYAVHAYTTVLIAVILSRAYLIAERAAPSSTAQAN